MKFLFDFFPVVLFFIVFKSYDNQVDGTLAATAVLMVATFAQIAYNWFRHQKVEKMHLITLILVLAFGAATIYFREPQFIIWKVTIAHWLFAIVFYASHFIGNKTPIIKRMMQTNISLPEPVWLRLSLTWIWFFILIGVINLLVAYFFDFDIWVDFKLFGILGLTLAFIIIQGIFLVRYIKEDHTQNRLNSNKPIPIEENN